MKFVSNFGFKFLALDFFFKLKIYVW
jgi:hypothetical protein